MLMYCRQVTITLMLLLCGATVCAEDAVAESEAPTGLYQISQQLIDANYSEKAAIAAQIAAVDSDRSLLILQTLLDGNLYYKKDDNSLLIVADEDNIRNAFTDEAVTDLGRRDKRKIGVNNSLRGTLRSLISQA